MSVTKIENLDLKNKINFFKFCFQTLLYCTLILQITLIKNYIVMADVLGELETGGSAPWVQ